MRNLKRLFLLIFCSVFMQQAVELGIFDKDSIECAQKYVKWADLIVVDLDNTVMYSANVSEANCQWCDVAEQRLQEKGFTKAEAFQKMVFGYIFFNAQAKMVPTEDAFVDFIHQVQSLGIRVIAITGRPDVMRNVTVEKLADIGVDLFSGFEQCDFKQLNGTHFIEGVIYNGYVGSPKKGESLKLFLETMKINPRNILMIDDRWHCLESVQTYLPAVNFVGIRYGRCDQAFKSFVPTQEMLDYIDQELSKATL